MAELEVVDQVLRVRFTLGERIAGLLLRDVELPLSAVDEVEVVQDGVAAVRGVRAPGLAVPGVRIGTWRRRGTRSLVSVRSGQPALRLRLHGERWDEVLVGAAGASDHVDRLAGRH